MARPKEFDPTAVLDSAVELFWRDGYERTSTADLVEGLGIARASLYATFGSKRALYLAALDRFLAGAGGATPTDALASHTSALEAVRAFLASSAPPPEARTPAGCLAVNAAVEHGDTDPEVSRRLEEGRRRLERAFHLALLMAQDDGELASGVDPRSTAAALVSLNTGLKVLARAGADQRERITTTVDATMAMLTRTDAA